ncbi:cytochrome c551/c552 [Pedobacter sp. CG_S7]|uniref:c-type cytochrome n=1 Tax=Pedobacter sp. CG_S7 TaxID=3143930 RepID=UPI00339B148C
MKSLTLICSFALVLAACGGSNQDKSSNATDPSSTESASTTGSNPSYDPNRGEGKFTDVKLAAKLDGVMASKGEEISDLKCASCHKMTDEKLVGPGWKGVTERNKPEWIMNFITNPDAMIDKDPKVQAMLEICMVRMPNQNLSDDDARALLEYMRKNDGVK